jgi:hypothetical protein
MTDKNIDELAELDRALEHLDEALRRLKDSARQYIVGTKIKYEGKFGVVTQLNQGSADPAGGTVDIRLDDGTVVAKVSVTTKALEFYHA